MDGGLFQIFDRKQNPGEVEKIEYVDKINDKEQNHKNF